MEQFTKSTLQELRQELNAALDPIAKKYGIKIELGNFGFTQTTFKTQLKAEIEGKERDYSEIYTYLNLPKLGTEFKMKGETFTVIHHNPSRPKYNISAKNSLGKVLEFNGEQISKFLERQKMLSNK